VWNFKEKNRKKPTYHGYLHFQTNTSTHQSQDINFNLGGIQLVGKVSVTGHLAGHMLRTSVILFFSLDGIGVLKLSKSMEHNI
jgi:hypothetical protein